MNEDYDSERIVSMDLFKKSLRSVRSALGNFAIIASRAVLARGISLGSHIHGRMALTFS